MNSVGRRDFVFGNRKWRADFIQRQKTSGRHWVSALPDIPEQQRRKVACLSRSATKNFGAASTVGSADKKRAAWQTALFLQNKWKEK